jgi:flagellar basal body-associated protein FliL
MAANGETSNRDSGSRGRTRLRIIGVVALLLGLGSAGIVYWMGTRAADVSDDSSMAGFNKADSRQMGMLYGQMGVMMQELIDDLKRPSIQAIIILVIAALVAVGCFYFARPPEKEDERN